MQNKKDLLVELNVEIERVTTQLGKTRSELKKTRRDLAEANKELSEAKDDLGDAKKNLIGVSSGFGVFGAIVLVLGAVYIYRKVKKKRSDSAEK